MMFIMSHGRIWAPNQQDVTGLLSTWNIRHSPMDIPMLVAEIDVTQYPLADFPDDRMPLGRVVANSQDEVLLPGSRFNIVPFCTSISIREEPIGGESYASQSSFGLKRRTLIMEAPLGKEDNGPNGMGTDEQRRHWAEQDARDRKNQADWMLATKELDQRDKDVSQAYKGLKNRLEVFISDQDNLEVEVADDEPWG